MAYPTSGDFRILKVHDEFDEPLPGAWAWNGPGMWRNTENGDLISAPLCYIPENSQYGELAQLLYSEDIVFHIDEETFTFLDAVYGHVGEPP